VDTLTKILNVNPQKLKIGITVVVLAFIGVMWFGYKNTMTFDVSDTALTVAYRNLFSRTSFTIAYADVERVELYTTAPKLRKDFGSDAGGTRVGTFSSPELGQFRAAIKDVSLPLLYIKTKEKAYMISPEDAAAVKQTIESKMAK